MAAVVSMVGTLYSGTPVYAADTSNKDNKSDISQITIDGELSEWEAMESLKVAEGNVEEWKLALSEDRSRLYFCFGGTAVTQWDTGYIWNLLEITYSDGKTFRCQIANLENAWTTPGAEVAAKNEAHLNNSGVYGVECVLPINDRGYSVTFAGTTVKEADIPEFKAAEEKEAVYTGISIDGKFDDWEAVTRVDVKCPNTSHGYECLKRAACIMDGDYVYFYLQDGDDGYAAGAGLNSNGRYSIVTDLGRSLVFQLSAANGGSVSGVDGAKAAYYQDEWEVAIPVSALPQWKKSISFGLYQNEPYISGVVDIKGGSNEEQIGEFNGIVYDGLYGDWAAYPHTLIQYATPGTQTDDPDGEGALYANGKTLYGHVVSSMEAHLQEQGGEFSSAVSICFNSDRTYNADKTWNFYPRLVTVADDGTIDWNPKTVALDNGVYEFYLADVRGEYNTSALKNEADLAEHEKFFGKMTVSVYDDFNETEFYVDLEQVAKFLSNYSSTEIKAEDFKVIEAQFGRIGQEWLTTAGASSGPYAGVIICMGVCVAVLLKRRKGNKAVE